MKSFIQAIKGAFIKGKDDVFSQDGLLMSSLPYFLLPVIMLVFYPIMWDHAWTTVILVYAVLPLIDQIFSKDVKNPTESQRKQLQKNDLYFRLCLYIPIILDWYIFFKAMDYFYTLQFTLWNCYNLPALLLIYSNLGGAQMVIAHQIYHKPGLFNRIFGTLHMSKNLYMHFSYEHLYGHHRNVGTPQDKASAPQGTTVYQCVPKAFIGTYKNVYKMQKQQQNKPFYRNYAVLSVISTIITIAVIFYFYNLQATLFFIIQAYLSIFFLESVNYIQHYGLRRKKLQNGEYEKVTIRHSWNAPYRFTNYIFFKLQRHSDHHENSMKPYQTLLSIDQSPQLPHGYSLMVMIAFYPRKWFQIMNPLLESYMKQQKQEQRKNIEMKGTELTLRYCKQLSSILMIFWIVSILRSE